MPTPVSERSRNVAFDQAMAALLDSSFNVQSSKLYKISSCNAYSKYEGIEQKRILANGFCNTLCSQRTCSLSQPFSATSKSALSSLSIQAYHPFRGGYMFIPMCFEGKPAFTCAISFSRRLCNTRRKNPLNTSAYLPSIRK